MGNQGSTHEPLERGQIQNTDFKMKSSVRNSLRRSSARNGGGAAGAAGAVGAGGAAGAGGALSPPRAGMERLRRSFRESFRRRGRKGSPPESARPHQWHADEAAVRAGTCTFPVKYLGCVEVFESRGMQVCEEALKVLRNSRRRPVRTVLHVSGDGLRVVEEETKGLIVDQTIEKVSFCAPDRNHERGFSYICRDGTTRRWMCHGFLAARDSGERLSHAVGCAFAACLERKQRRDKECAVTMSIDAASHAFTRQGSFRKSGITRRMSEADTPSPAPAPAPAPVGAPGGGVGGGGGGGGRAAHNPFAVERPHAAPHLLERQGSFRGFAHLNNNSPFKRQMSLRISELPSNLERTRAGLVSPPTPPPASAHAHAHAQHPPPIPELPAHSARQEHAAIEENGMDPVAAMCQQLSTGLRALAEEPVPRRRDHSPVSTEAVPAARPLPHPDAWLGKVAGAGGAPTPTPTAAPTPAPTAAPPPARAPPLSARAHSYAGHAASTNPFLTPAHI